MPKRIPDEKRKDMVDWYLAEDERTCLDLAWEFSIAPGTAQKIVKAAGVGKNPARNPNRNRPKDGRGSKKPSGKSIKMVRGRSNYRGHRRRG